MNKVSKTITLRINLKLKLSGLYSSLFVVRVSLIFQKNGGGEQKRAKKTFDEYDIRFEGFDF